MGQVELNYQVLALWTRMDLGVMSKKEYSEFLKAPALVEPYHQVI